MRRVFRIWAKVLGEVLGTGTGGAAGLQDENGFMVLGEGLGIVLGSWDKALGFGDRVLVFEKRVLRFGRRL